MAGGVPCRPERAECFCAPFGVACGFGSTPVLALGNEDLECRDSPHLGSRATKAFSLAGHPHSRYYRSRSSNLVTSLLPQVGTALGRLNPRFGPWEGPAGLPSAAVDQIRTFVPLLVESLTTARTSWRAASYTNFGEVNTQGIDLGVELRVPRGVA